MLFIFIEFVLFIVYLGLYVIVHMQYYSSVLLLSYNLE